MVSKIELENFLKMLPLPSTEKWPLGVWDINAISHGYMSVSLFTPRRHDYQTPHEQDEIYVVFKGQGKLVTQIETFDFVSGDILFVQSGDEHRFEDFTDDLILWVIFYGPKGGEP